MNDPRYLRPGFDFALAHAVEEAGEFLAAAGKTQRWGRDSVNPEIPPQERETNEDWLVRELADLIGALTRLSVETGRGDPIASALVFARAEARAAGSLMLEMQQNCIALRQMLVVCRDQFAFYERSHRAKGTADADAKAAVNADMVARIDAAIEAKPAAGGLPRPGQLVDRERVAWAIENTKSAPEVTPDELRAFLARAVRDERATPPAASFDGMLSLIIRLHAEEGLSEGQTARATGFDRPTIRALREWEEAGMIDTRFDAHRRGCTCQRPPTHLANDCPIHGLDDDDTSRSET